MNHQMPGTVMNGVGGLQVPQVITICQICSLLSDIGRLAEIEFNRNWFEICTIYINLESDG